MPTSNHKQIRNLFVAAIVLTVPLSVIGSNVSNASKSALKPGIIKCDDLKLKNRGYVGYVRGIVTKREKDKWTYQEVATLAESNSCETPIKFSPNSKMSGLIRPGAKLTMAVKIESEYEYLLLNDNVSTDDTLIPLDGKVPETQTIVEKLGDSLMPDWGKSLTINYDPYGFNPASYHFPEEVAAKLRPNVKQKWYFQAKEIGSKSFIVSDVETVD
jgi:hypothetical protein